MRFGKGTESSYCWLVMDRQEAAKLIPSPLDLSGLDAIVCDIDGCLGPESTDPMDITGLEWIRNWNMGAVEEGLPRLTLCSGRPLPFVEAVCRVICNTSLPAICENGVWLFDPASNGFLRDPAITSAEIRAVHEASEWIETDFGPRGVVIQPGKAASISLWHPDVQYLRELAPRLVARFSREGWPFRVSMTVAWINCDLTKVSKGTGLQRFAERTGLQKHRMIGIGDSASDLVMKEHVRAFACPANAAAEVKAASDLIARQHEIFGVCEILSMIREQTLNRRGAQR